MNSISHIPIKSVVISNSLSPPLGAKKDCCHFTSEDSQEFVSANDLNEKSEIKRWWTYRKSQWEVQMFGKAVSKYQKLLMEKKFLESWSTFFQFRTTVRYFTLTGSGECAFQLLYVIVTVLAHIRQYCGAHNEQCIKTPNEFAAHKLLIPLKVTQFVK